jgi:hypothetical protein
MLASMRSRFLFCLVVASCVATFLPLQAQVNGVPPSVTSMGFGSNFVNGVRPGVTSLGPNAYNNNWTVLGNCCASFFPPPNPNLSTLGRHRHHRDQGAVVVGVIEPAYVPYAVPYAPEPDDDSLEADAAYSPVPPPPVKRQVNHDVNRDSAPKADADTAEEPVPAQPSTVLVFKDGHQSDVLNYAIVGNTLFDFADGRTRKILLADLDLKATQKANDDRGVDFAVPSGATGQ